MERIVYYLQYPFVQYALIVGIFISVCSALLGVTLVLKRFSFIGDGLSHIAFGAMAAAGVLGLANPTPFVMFVTILCAILLLRVGQDAKIKGDATIAMISVGALAVGYLLMNLFPNNKAAVTDVHSTLFGSTSILTLSSSQVWLCVITSILVMVVYAFCYQRFFSVTFDENFARATGVHVELYHLLIAVLTAVIIVLAMNLVGSLLISALIIFPALSAMRLFDSFLSVTVFSVLFSVVCAVSGILISIIAGTPVGSTIVVVDIVGFLLCWAIGMIKK